MYSRVQKLPWRLLHRDNHSGPAVGYIGKSVGCVSCASVKEIMRRCRRRKKTGRAPPRRLLWGAPPPSPSSPPRICRRAADAILVLLIFLLHFSIFYRF